MRLSVNEDGNVRIDQEPDGEQITINIGPAENWCFGGKRTEPGIGPLVPVVVIDQAVKAMVDEHHVQVGHSYLEMQFSPLEESEEPHAP